MKLPEHLQRYFKFLIRQEYRKQVRGKARGAKKWGAEFDPTMHDARIAMAKEAYAFLGGDPDKINLKDKEESP